MSDTCGSGTICDSVVVITTHSSLAHSPAIDLYPNPARDQIRIKYDLYNLSEMRIEMLSANGQVVRRWDYDDQQKGELNLPTTDLPRGIYLVRITGEGFLWDQKLILQ